MSKKNSSLFPDLEYTQEVSFKYPSPKNGKAINDWLFQNIPEMSEGRYVNLWQKLNKMEDN